MANTFNGTVSTKYLDWTGLSHFWTKAKAYIATEIGAAKTELNNKIDANDAAIRAYVESLSVNGVPVVSNKEEGKLGTVLSVVIDGTNIALTDAGKTALAAGTLVKKDPTAAATSYDAAETVEEGLIQLDKRVDAVETAFTSGVVNSFTATTKHDTAADQDDVVEWVKLDNTSKQVGEVSIEIDDTAIDNKFESIDREIVTLQANSGVVGIEIVDSPAADADANLVAFTMDVTKMDGQADDKVAGHESYRKGLLKLTVDESKLNTKVENLEDADANEAASRKADIELLAGTGYTAGTDGNVGSWGETQLDYPTIVALDKRMKEIDENVVTKIEEKDSVENYVTFEVKETQNTNGDDVVTLTINDSALDTKIKAMDKTHSDYATAETAARKDTDAFLAGSSWSKDTNTWGSTLEYQDITAISTRVSEIDEAIDALSTATHFIGVSSTEITHDGTQKPTINGTVVDPVSGDVVIYGHKEFIWSAGKWVELGDTTVENQRLDALETWVDEAIISTTEIDTLFASASN